MAERVKIVVSESEHLREVPEMMLRVARAVSHGGDESEYLEPDTDGEPILSTTIEGYKDVFLLRLNAMRRERAFTDCIVFVGGREILAHRCVLAAMSPTILNELEQERKSTITTNGSDNLDNQKGFPSSQTANRPSYLEFNEASFECFEALVNFGYSGQLDIRKSSLPDLYRLANQLRMAPVAEICAKYLGKNLSPKNCIAIRRAANKHSDTLLLKKVDEFIHKNLDAIIETSNQVKELPRIKVQLIGALTELTGVTASQQEMHKLADKVLGWLQADVEDIRDFRLDMLIEKPHLLYFNDDLTLHDCTDMDDRCSVHSSDLVQDYKKDAVNRPSALQGRKSRHPSGLPQHKQSINGEQRRNYQYKSQESVYSTTGSSASNEHDEIDWRVIAVTQTAENYLFALAVVNRTMCILSIHQIDAATCCTKTGALYNERMAHVAKCLKEDVSRVPLASMYNTRAAFGAVAIDRFIFVCGGYTRGNCLSACEQYDTKANCWTKLPDLNTKRGRCSAALLYRNIGQADPMPTVFVVGGSSGSMDLSTVEYFDAGKCKWLELKAKMRQSRSSCSSVTVDNKIYILGGWNGTEHLKSCEVYDPITEQFTTIASMPIGRSQAGVCAWLDAPNGPTILVAGGQEGWSSTATLFQYEITKDRWTQLPSMNTPRRGCGAVVVDGYLYVAGGSDSGHSLASVETFDLNAHYWLPLANSPAVLSNANVKAMMPTPNLLLPRANAAAVVVLDKIYALGGFDGHEFLATSEYLQPGWPEWRGWKVRETGPILEKGESVLEHEAVDSQNKIGDQMAEYLAQMQIRAQ